MGCGGSTDSLPHRSGSPASGEAGPASAGDTGNAAAGSAVATKGVAKEGTRATAPPLAKAAPAPADTPLHYYTLSVVRREHSSASSLWCAIRGKVYNLTSFLNRHPGGREILLECSTGDATAAFEGEHAFSQSANSMLKKLQIGLLVPEGDPRAGQSVPPVAAAGEPTTNDPSLKVSPAMSVAGSVELSPAGTVGEEDANHRRFASSSVGSGAAPAHVSVLQSYTMAEVAAHHTLDDCWTVRKGQVYNLTRYFPQQKENPMVATASGQQQFKLPTLELKKLAGLDATSYFESSSTLLAEPFLQQLEKYQIGFLVNHAPTAPVGEHNLSRHGSRRGSMSVSAGLPAANARYGAGSDEAAEALNAIAADDLTHAAAEGLIASPSAVRYLWRLTSRDACTHDTQLLTFHPVVSDVAIHDWMRRFDEDESALHAAYPVQYSTHVPAIKPGQHLSVEIPKHLPRENAENHGARERENRPLDVPFRMQRAYSPLNSYQGDQENPRRALTFLIRHYPGFKAGEGRKESIPAGAGSTFMTQLPLGGIITTTGARGLFDCEQMFDAYDTFLLIGGGTGVCPIYPILKDLLQRCANSTAATAAARSSGGAGLFSPSSSSVSPSGVAAGLQFTKQFVVLSCHRSEEDVLLESELSELQTEAGPGRPGVNIFTVLSQPMFSPKASTFSGQLNLDMLRLTIPPAFQPTIMHVLPADGNLDSSRGMTSRSDTPSSRIGSGSAPSSRPRSPAKFNFGIPDRAPSPGPESARGGPTAGAGEMAASPTPKDDGSLLRKTLGVMNAGRTSSRRPSAAGVEGRVPGLLLPEPAAGPQRKALVILCGPPGFNQAVLQLVYRFGFKRGRGNPTGKDVFVL